MTTTLLPTKPSALIRVALADLQKCENDDAHYRIDMDWWYDKPEPGDVCAVCLAGAVMAQTLELRDEGYISPICDSDLREFVPQLYALDDFRTGRIESGLQRLGFNVCDYPRLLQEMEDADVPCDITDYADHSGMFFEDMNELADWFEDLGL